MVKDIWVLLWTPSIFAGTPSTRGERAKMSFTHLIYKRTVTCPYESLVLSLLVTASSSPSPSSSWPSSSPSASVSSSPPRTRTTTMTSSSSLVCLFYFMLVAASSPAAASSCWVHLLPSKFSALPPMPLLPLLLLAWFIVVGLLLYWMNVFVWTEWMLVWFESMAEWQKVVYFLKKKPMRINNLYKSYGSVIHMFFFYFFNWK